ncbi:hypothetical protein JCM19053_1257 [Vibrio sp. JCM 19053]|nr:hypothetical protein JCM19053_1257 [Vibrio sp. JCM 19053]
MYQQTQRADFQQKKFNSVTPKVAAPKNKSTLKRCQLWIFTSLVNTESRYDNFNSAL